MKVNGVGGGRELQRAAVLAVFFRDCSNWRFGVSTIPSSAAPQHVPFLFSAEADSGNSTVLPSFLADD